MPITSALPLSTATSFDTNNWRQSDNVQSSDTKNISFRDEPRALLSMEDILALLNNKSNSKYKETNNSPIVLNVPDDCSKNISPEVKIQLIEIIKNPQHGHDIDLSEKLVDATATLFGSQINSGAPLTRAKDNLEPDQTETTTPTAASPQARTFAAVENGTDITAPDTTGFNYVNVMGDAKLVTALIAVLTVFNQQEALANTLSAKWSKNIVASATLVGDKAVAAAAERRTGAMVSGVMNLGIHGTSTVRACRALKQESTSITKNMSEANRIDRQLSAGTKADNPLALSEKRDQLRVQHDLVGKNSSSAMQQAELIKQTGAITKETVNSGYDVNAAAETKESELARAGQSLSSEMGNVHSQTARKANESESSLRQSMLAMLSSNNEAVAAIASRMG